MWGFGFLAGLWWFLFWPLVVLAFGIDLYFMTKKAAAREMGALTFCAALLLVALHLFGFVSIPRMYTYLVDNWRHLAAYAGWFVGLGFAYMNLKGLLKLLKYSAELRKELRDIKENRLERIKQELTRANAPADEATVAAAWEDEKVNFLRKKRVRIGDWKYVMLGWWILWPLDLAWEILFQWFGRLLDTWDFLWSGLSRLYQQASDWVLRRFVSGV